MNLTTEERRNDNKLSGVGRSFLLVAALVLIDAPSSTAQDILWDRIGDGVRSVQPFAFELIGDLTGDGLPEVIWGGGSRALIMSSEDALTIQTVVRTWPTHGFADSFPLGFCNVGDLNADGIEDYSLSAIGFSTSTLTWTGKVFFYSGQTHQVISNLFLGNNFEGFGHPVKRIGDINGDGEVDFVIGANGPRRIYYGPNWTLAREYARGGISGLGDINRDGFDDYGLGEGGTFQAGGSIPGQGRVQVISGIDGRVLFEVYGTHPYEGLGGVYGRGGDWSGDGLPDLVVTAGGDNSGPSGVYVFDGTDSTTLRYFAEIDYATRDSKFGLPNSSGRDVNGDGVPDLIIGARDNPQFPSGGQGLDIIVRGSAFVFSGLTGALLWEVQGEHAGQHLGKQVELIEDFNGDGLADFAILSQDYDLTPEVLTDGPHEGRLTFYAGARGDAVTVCRGGENSTGQHTRLWNSGPISVGQNRFELALAELPPGSLAVMMHGLLTPPNPLGAGQLCLGTPLGVLGFLSSPSNDTNARLPLDLRAPPFTSGGNVIRAGDRWTFQALYRDGGTRNTSSALDVVFVP